MTLSQALRWLDDVEYVIECLALNATAEARAALVELILDAESDQHLDGADRARVLDALEGARAALITPPESPEAQPAYLLSRLTRHLWRQVH
ncbi:hypothetical protein [Isoalcanivorax beigongshangi]|uniref:Uncharacterized protein n=1 Tax=Isoalcanivorax beigongshangi TaxID=3238810 RepID=A0ABV4AIS9_9GAMM